MAKAKNKLYMAPENFMRQYEIAKTNLAGKDFKIIFSWNESCVRICKRREFEPTGTQTETVLECDNFEQATFYLTGFNAAFLDLAFLIHI